MRMFHRPLMCMFVLSLTLVVGLGSNVPADDTSKSNAKGDTARKTVSTEAKVVVPATSIDFASALDVAFDSLTGLGGRIEQARKAGDPVGLSCAAHELAMAEQVGGKQAPIKSADLHKEAVEMALARKRPQELKALALTTKDEEIRSQLREKTSSAEKAAASRKTQNRATGITGRLIVENRTRYYIDLYVNYGYIGTILPFGVMHGYVGDDAGDITVLFGRAPGTSYTWGPRTISGYAGDYTWTLNP